jgi:hypothetical protein
MYRIFARDFRRDLSSFLKVIFYSLDWLMPPKILTEL